MSDPKSSVAAFYSDASLGLCLFRNILFIDLWGPAEVVHMRTIEQGYKMLHARNPGGVCGLARVDADVPLPSKEVRHEAARFMRELDPVILASATVIENKGTVGQLLVTVLRGLNMLAGTTKARAVTSIEEAATMLAPIAARGSGAPMSSGEILEAAVAARDAAGRTSRRPRASGR